ncbi:bile acid:sodium symporter [Puniceicoccaceae bacterium K14]|nr:bile acid:sodium symporter [Puniceicoccaceae bacterium K14]
MSINSKVVQFIKSQGFLVGLFGAVVAALIVPQLGERGGPLKPEITTKLAVILTFVIQGLSLPTRQILKSAMKFRLHAYCQISAFAVAPLLMLGTLFLVGDWIHESIRYGFIYLAVLPTTISSAIVMTTNANGDSSSALFSTTLSNILGIFITPLFCAQLIGTTSGGFPPVGPLISKLSILILLPLIAGQLIRPFVREWAQSSKKLFKRLSNGFIVFIVFAAFCNSVQSGVWQSVGFLALIKTFLLVSAFLGLFSVLVWSASPIGASNYSERITILFCGSQKTLAAGVPMAAVIFAETSGNVNPGLIILPIMCYHPMQLFLAGYLVGRFNKQR